MKAVRAATLKQTKTVRKISAAAALPTLALGFVCFTVANRLDGGFIGGFFQGATIALLLVGVYLIGSSMWYGRKQGTKPSQDADGWLPSRDSTPSGATSDTDLLAERGSRE